MAEAEATKPFCVHLRQIESASLCLCRSEVLVIRNVAPGKQRASLAQRLQEFEFRKLGHTPWR
jgi:hypothetical protein